MPPKHNSHQGQTKKPQNQIVDQQNEPFLRTIFKRVRNINKKLTEIQELKKKQDLKPEQQEKINRKKEYEAQKSRLENIADFFREVYAENAEQYKNNQLQELDHLANAIAILRSNAPFKESDKLNDLNNVISEPITTGTLDQNVQRISSVLRKYATDQKLRKNIRQFLESNASKELTEEQPEPEVKPQSQSQQQPQTPKEESQKKAPVESQSVEQKSSQQESTPQVVQAETPKLEEKEPIVEKTQGSTEPTKQEATTEQSVSQEEKAQNAEGVEGEKKPRGEYKNRRPRNNRRDGGDRERRDNNNGGERREYRGDRPPRNNEGRPYRANPQKTKYQAKQRDEANDSDSSLQEPTRNFRRDEIRQLEDDGFTVVKTKQKARDQKQWHEHTHGKKNHPPRRHEPHHPQQKQEQPSEQAPKE